MRQTLVEKSLNSIEKEKKERFKPLIDLSQGDKDMLKMMINSQGWLVLKNKVIPALRLIKLNQLLSQEATAGQVDMKRGEIRMLNELLQYPEYSLGIEVEKTQDVGMIARATEINNKS